MNKRYLFSNTNKKSETTRQDTLTKLYFDFYLKIAAVNSTTAFVKCSRTDINLQFQLFLG